MRQDEKNRLTAGAGDVDGEPRTGRSWSMIAIIAIVVAVGLAFWAMSDRGASTSTASRKDNVTTGASPSNPPPVKSPIGQGESNSAR